MTTKGNPKLTIRMDPEERAGFVADAYNAGTTGSELVIAFIRRWRSLDPEQRASWLSDPDAPLPERPPRPGHD